MTAPPKPRWPRYSLWTMFVVVTVVALAAFGVVEHFRRRALEEGNAALQLEVIAHEAELKMRRSIPHLYPQDRGSR